MNRRRRRKIALLIVLVLLLALLGALYYNFRLNKTVGLTFAPPTADVMQAPTYLFSFSGGTNFRLIVPTGVLFDTFNNTVYVTDPGSALIFQFDPNGKLLKTFGKGVLHTPLYLAVNPLTRNIYVSDRGRKSIFIYDPNGKYVGKFDPHLPKNQLPTFKTPKGIEWEPVVFDFAPDGSLYVVDILKAHRLLVFDPSGRFVKSVGQTGTPKNGASSAPMFFMFPNGLAVRNGLVYVADSNNQRIQVFGLDGTFKKIFATSGLPRGIAFLNKWGPIKAVNDFVTIDPLAQMATIYGGDGKSILTFGEQGVGDGQFSYPNSISVSGDDHIYVADSQNSRVQVWGWPATVVPVPVTVLAQNWPWCLTPLLLLPLLLLRRKRKFVASRDFVAAMVAAEQVDTMPASRRKWFVMPEDYEALKETSQGDIRLGDLLEPAEHSPSDAKAIEERLETTPEIAALLSVAKRSYLFCTEDPDLRRMAKLLDTEVVNMAEFLDRFSKKLVEPKTEE